MTAIELKLGDITKFNGDAIVNAANESLMGGGGVDGAIHYAAGPELNNECARLNGCRTGEAKITAAYRLPAKYIIHTVGPVWHAQPSDAKKLKSCYVNSLRLAIQNDCKTVAFPSISTGAYGYPVSAAARIAITTIQNYPSNLIATIICYDRKTFQAYQAILNR
ncbi:O-acetyl-ADP-ribose deacetylase (plasmid) [Nicoliella spurrieriana]|uniref:O-acetyl-ADP-ribose deacetylase n=1 Tax=Nicoliella spurrieriana TaxID=2925830 RepID=A0A976RQW2_9LACO|nr:O-acetyl-ADP-ribose deacetylase [Nicoliella spurrieriana]UQS86193.1 O-acetyl-ADP-ribose deacetylase [Nicoliella spurrieriana]